MIFRPQLETNINLPFIAADATGPKHFNKTLTRNEFEDSDCAIWSSKRSSRVERRSKTRNCNRPILTK